MMPVHKKITSMFILALFHLGLLVNFVQPINQELIVRRSSLSASKCFTSLSSSKEDFPDASFSASSVLNDRSDFQPHQARLTNVYDSQEHTSGYAWCPNSPIHNDGLREWVQAEFQHLVIISTIFTAGRGDGNVREFMPNFVLRYQREDDGEWFEHVNRDGTKILKANSDPRNPARATLDSVVIAKRIRIYPYSRTANQNVCLRFALYGCNFPDGIVSYAMPQGSLRRPLTTDLASNMVMQTAVPNFKDLIYDGRKASHYLSAGLGQLTDNVAYMGNVTTPLDFYPGQIGFHFVGWHRAKHKEVEITFKFDAERNFTRLRLFTFDSIMLNARLFDRAVIEFSRDGRNFDSGKVEVSTGRAQLVNPSAVTGGSASSFATSSQPGSRIQRGTSSTTAGASNTDPPLLYTDNSWDGALVVQLDLGHKIGRYVRLRLSSADQWLLLSEVQFNSTIVTSTPVPRVAAKDVGEGQLDKKTDELSQIKGDKGDGEDSANALSSSLESNRDDSVALKDDAVYSTRSATNINPEQKLSWVHVVVICIASIILVLLFAFSTVCLVVRSQNGRLFRSGGANKSHKHRLVTSPPGGALLYPPLPHNALLNGGQYVRGGNGGFLPLNTDQTLLNGTTLMQQQQQQTQPMLLFPSRPLPTTTTSTTAQSRMGVDSTGQINLPATTSSQLTFATDPTTGRVISVQCSPNSNSNSSQATSHGQDTQNQDLSNAQMNTADVGSLSPEYASASIFGLTPPPSETPPIVSSVMPGSTSTNPVTAFGGGGFQFADTLQRNPQTNQLAQFNQPTNPSNLMYLPRTTLDGSVAPAGFCHASPPLQTNGGTVQPSNMYLLYEQPSQLSFPSDRHASWVLPNDINPGTWTINPRQPHPINQPSDPSSSNLLAQVSPGCNPNQLYPTLIRQPFYAPTPINLNQFCVPQPTVNQNMMFSSGTTGVSLSTGNNGQVSMTRDDNIVVPTLSPVNAIGQGQTNDDTNSNNRLSIYSVCT